MSLTELIKASSPISLDEKAVKKLETVALRLKSENEKYNLTSLTSDEEIAFLHFADCLQLLKHLDLGGKRVIDVGCGGGFPALVLAAADESLFVTALDSTAKKLTFVAETARLAGINNVKTLTSRAEDIAPDRRESFDAAVSRGVTRLAALSELCLPYVKVGGVFAAMKGAGGEAEATEASAAITALGGRLVDVIQAPVPRYGDEHCIVVVEKVSPCPKKYPRPWAKIKSSPIK